MTWRERAEKLAEEYQKQVFKCNPNGFTVAPYVNEDSHAMAFEAGFEAGRNDAREEAKALVEAAENSISVMMEYNFNNSDSFKIRAMYLDLTKALKDWEQK